MKKLICVILLMVLICVLAGCAINEESFPRLEVDRSNIRADTIYIALRDGYNFSIKHLYDEVDTENGYDIIVHIVEDN